jgi:hypothetical protein
MNTNSKPNIWFWIIAVVAFVWNAMGVMRYLMQAYDTESFRAEFTEVQLIAMDANPAWLTGLFATAVFSGLLGCILLLIRKKLAVVIFGLSLLAVLIQMIYLWLATDAIEVFGMVNGIVMPLLVIVIAIFLYFYSKGAAQKGWLK